jgi:cellulose synthase/poly-beta-1,6-N-acetylglucosamine synthase-like glycosyltransferase
MAEPATPSLPSARLCGYAALAAAAVAGHLGYPAALWLLTRRRPEPPAPAPPTAWPSVTIVIAAYLEAAVLPRKLRECFSDGYPGSLEVLVVADDAASAATARAGGARVLSADHRRGKAAALSAGIDASHGEVVVITDANASLAPGTVATLARWFSDPSIGAVAGDKRHSHGREGFYWAFESWLKRREQRLGTTIGLVGECAAVRRATAPSIAPWTAVDDLWLALSVAESGLRIGYEPDAVAVEAPAPAGEEWERRTRIVAGAIQLLWHRRRLLGAAHPLLAFEIWGHRLWRMTIGPAANLLLVGVAARDSMRGGRGAGLARVVVAGHLAGVAAVWAGERAPGPARAAGQALYLQLVGLGGMARLARGDVAATWPKTEREAAA